MSGCMCCGSVEGLLCANHAQEQNADDNGKLVDRINDLEAAMDRASSKASHGCLDHSDAPDVCQDILGILRQFVPETSAERIARSQWEYSCARCGARGRAPKRYETWECSRCGAAVGPLKAVES